MRLRIPPSLPSLGRRLSLPTRSITSFPFPTVPVTPAPKCSCSSLPEGSESLEFNFDTTHSIQGTVAAHDEHVVVATGRRDWSSRIEDEDTIAGEVVKEIKQFSRQGGGSNEHTRNLLVSTGSFSVAGPEVTGVYLFPSFVYVPCVQTSSQACHATTQGGPSVSTKDLTNSIRTGTSPDGSPSSSLVSVPVNEIVVLICGHGGRDMRCGAIGPLLQEEFARHLRALGMVIIQTRPDSTTDTIDHRPGARVELISHIGGHVYAGNVIIYVPPSLKTHPLAGRGIWYGRVNPSRVEGIVRETIARGTVITELLRGVIPGL